VSKKKSSSCLFIDTARLNAPTEQRSENLTKFVVQSSEQLGRMKKPANDKIEQTERKRTEWTDPEESMRPRDAIAGSLLIGRRCRSRLSGRSERNALLSLRLFRRVRLENRLGLAEIIVEVFALLLVQPPSHFQ
jgi:hypothetical protein